MKHQPSINPNFVMKILLALGKNRICCRQRHKQFAARIFLFRRKSCLWPLCISTETSQHQRYVQIFSDCRSGSEWCPEGILTRSELSQSIQPFHNNPIRIAIADAGLADRVWHPWQASRDSHWPREYQAGFLQRVWDGKNSMGQPISSGLYFYKLVAFPLDGSNPFVQTKKMILLK